MGDHRGQARLVEHRARVEESHEVEDDERDHDRRRHEDGKLNRHLSLAGAEGGGPAPHSAPASFLRFTLSGILSSVPGTVSSATVKSSSP